MKRFWLTYLLASTICFSANAAVVFFGDSTASPPSSMGIARSCQYARLHGTMGGSGTVVMDSILIRARAGRAITTVGYAVIGLYLDSALTKPASRYSIDTITMTDSSIAGFNRYVKVPQAAISATAGVTYWIGVSCGALSDKSDGFTVGLNTASIGAIQSCSGVLTNPWAGGTPATGSYFVAGYWGHDGSSSGGTGSTTEKTIGASLVGDGLH